MVRKLKFHESKLLKKVDFINWELDNNIHENKIMHRYQVEKREHYTLYNKLSREIREVARKIRDLEDKNPNKAVLAKRMIGKLYNLGIIPTADTLERCDKVTASSFCRRRLPVVMYKMDMAPSIKKANELVLHGHVRVGPELVTDPAFLVTREQGDYVTWARESKTRQQVLGYTNERDDFDE